MAKTKRPKVDPRWIRNASDRSAIKAGCWFDDEAAERVCGFFEKFLCHSKGRYRKKPFRLEAWQRDFLSRLFGWKNADGFRRFREAYLEIPKKNGKSTLLSGLCLLGLFEEPGAEVYVGAVDRSQASIIFDESSRMTRSSPSLAKHLRIIPSKKRITYPANDAKFEAMSADAPSKDGVDASLCVLDETHRHRTDALYEVMQYAGAARDQPLLINITTAGIANKHALWHRLHDQAVAIEKGSTDDLTFLGVIYAADPERDDLDDPATWRKCNPSMGGGVIKEADFAKDYAKAKRLPRTLANFLRLRMNVAQEQAIRWLPVSKWDALADPIDLEELRGETCYGALDLSSVKDLSALTLAFPRDEGIRFVNFIFVPEETVIERGELDQVPYPAWADAGHLILTPGNSTDHAAIREKVKELAGMFDLVLFGGDPWGIDQLLGQIADDGTPVRKIRQGYASLSAPCKELERIILSGQMRHDGNPCVRWAVGNVAVEQDAAGNIKPSKAKSTERIDPVCSTVMALALVMGNSNNAVPSITIIGPGTD